jgi:hypothetical protein
MKSDVPSIRPGIDTNDSDSQRESAVINSDILSSTHSMMQGVILCSPGMSAGSCLAA